MLGNEVQLFFQLLDSLSNSLRELAVKYELLVSTTSRQSNSIEKTDVSLSEMANDVASSFEQISKEFDLLKGFASDSKYKEVALDSSMKEISNLLSSMNNNIIDMMKSISSAENISRENKSVAVHIDAHMDGFGNQLTSIQTINQSFFQELSKMITELQAMKIQLEPFKKLAVLFSKPVSIILGIYFLVVTVLAIMKVKSEYDQFIDQKTSSISSIIEPANNQNKDLK